MLPRRPGISDHAGASGSRRLPPLGIGSRAEVQYQGTDMAPMEGGETNEGADSEFANKFEVLPHVLANFTHSESST